MKYRLVQTIENKLIATEFGPENVVSAMAVRGYKYIRLNYNSRQRDELQEQPIFTGILGPMWDGDAVRYEDPQ